MRVRSVLRHHNDSYCMEGILEAGQSLLGVMQSALSNGVTEAKQSRALGSEPKVNINCSCFTLDC